MSRMLRIAAAGAAFTVAVTSAAFVGAAHAVAVSGRVTNEGGAGVFNVDLDFTDRSTGQIVFTPFDNTDAGGFYSTDVPPGEYDVLFNSPSDIYLDREVRQFEVLGPATLDAVLLDAFPVSGVVVDGGAAPVGNVDLDFLDLASGDVVDTNQDNTAPDGTFLVYVSDALYDVFFTPPLGVPFAGLRIPGINIAGASNLGTITLETGYPVHLKLLGIGGAPVANTDVDFEVQPSGAEIYTPRDNTDASGDVNPMVPAGAYEIIAKPAPATGLAWSRIPNVIVTGPSDLGEVHLAPGFAVTGVVRNTSAAPVVGANLDLIRVADGVDLPAASDNTSATGAFSLLAPATTLDVIVKPPPAANLAAGIVRNVGVTGPTDLGVITLVAGHVVFGTVRDVFGSPVVGADLDAFELPSGLKYPTLNDDSNSSGAYSIRLPAGNWRIVCSPPVGAPLLSSTIDITLTANLVLHITLPSSNVGAPVVRAGDAFLGPATPNPFFDSTRFSFDLARDSRVSLRVFDLAGRVVRELVDSPLPAGRHEASWNGRDARDLPAGPGVYFYRLETPENIETRKVVRLR